MEVEQVLTADGTVVGDVPDIHDDQLLEMMRLMLLGRALDGRATALQRRGKLGTYPPQAGQEAASVGMAFAMDRSVDTFVPQYREQLAMFAWGLPISTYLLQRMGHPAGTALPSHGRLWPQQVALAAHLPHAVGLAWGNQLRERDGVVLTSFGDGASNEGDFHEALNIAGVRRAPVVLVCQNNGWAISIPWQRQSAAESVAARAAGYGFPGVAVDGNDVLAMYSVTARARRRAAVGEGPTLIEARTTRLGAHSTSDDPSRYVPEEYAQDARRRDPLLRFRAWLTGRGLWNDDREAEAQDWCRAQLDEALAEVQATPRPEPDLVFDELFAVPDSRLVQQRTAFLAQAVAIR